jgi:hypothetical protein
MQPKTNIPEAVEPVQQAAKTEEEQTDPVLYTITARDGRVIHITDDRQEYARLVAEGKIVFDSKEMALVRESQATPEQAASFLNIKEKFPGARIDRIAELESKPEQPAVLRETGTCYWAKK